MIKNAAHLLDEIGTAIAIAHTMTDEVVDVQMVDQELVVTLKDGRRFLVTVMETIDETTWKQILADLEIEK